MEVGGDLRSLKLRATPPVVPKGRLETVCATGYDEVIPCASLQDIF